ncbi:hypothetical protein FA95DRAFT_1504367, partial [Auriscalpium vulgare]
MDTRSGRVLKEAVEPRRIEAREINAGLGNEAVSDKATAGADVELATSVRTDDDRAPVDIQHDDELLKQVKLAYANDATFGKVMENIEAYPTFEITDGVITTVNRAGEKVMCIPKGMHGKRSIIEIVISQGHRVLGHMGSQKTTDYLRRWYWW